MNYEGNFHWQLRVVQQGPWKVETLKLLFFLTNNDSQQLIIVDMISKCPTKKVLAMQWDTHEAYKCWCSSTSIEQSMSVLQSVFFVVSLLEASPVHETLWDTKRGSPKVWKSDISCLWLSYKWQENISFSMLGKMTAVLE